MSALPAVSCCCDPGVLWYALKCEDYFDNYCCAPDCAQAPDRIEFCVGYLISLGIPDPPDIATKCYYISYDCCIYILTNFEALPCPNPLSIWPVNVGELVKVKNRVVGENPCCYPDPQQQGNPGGIANIQIPEYGPAIANNTQLPCEELVAECYDFKDQAGTVKGKSVTVASSARTCIETIGVPWYVRCDHGPPVEIVSLDVGMSQEMGFCTVRDPVSPANCPNQVTQSYVQYMTCPDCEPEGDCCGNTPICDDLPDYCDSFYDRFETYDVRTCYSINAIGCPVHEEDIMTIVFPACFAPGIDPEDPGAQAALNALFLGSSGLVHIDQNNTVATGWGTLGAPKLSVCGLDIVIFSGNAAHIAERINTRIGALVTASGIPPWSAWFWFGNRQSCVTCDWQTPNDRPGFSDGDTLTVDRVEFTNGNQDITVTLVGSSPRYYACASQTLLVDTTWGRSGDTCNASISAITATPNNYVLQCLSFPEYSFGERYSMKRVQEYASPDIQICVDIAFFQDATGCEARDGWPLEDITVNIGGNDIVLVYGWSSLCQGMPDPRTGCYAYPFTYEPAPCCPQGEDCSPGGQWDIDHPLPQPCLRSFQSPRIYCKSDGSVVTLTS